MPDPAGDIGPTLLMLLPDPEKATSFIAALRAEGIAGPPGSLSCITMREWGLHWYFNIPSLVNKRSNARDGFPWTHPANAFAADYDYGHGALPVCDDVHARGTLLTISSNLSEQDIRDIVLAIRKVAANLWR